MKTLYIGRIFFFFCLVTMFFISGCVTDQGTCGTPWESNETNQTNESEGTEDNTTVNLQELPYPVKWSFSDIGGSSEYSYGTPVSASPALDSEGNIYGVSGEKLHKVDSNGNKVWELQITENIGESISTPPAIASDGTIYVGTYNPSLGNGETEGKVYSINSDGTLKWEYSVKEWDPVMDDWVPGNTINPFAIASDGTIYTAGKNGFVHALNPDGTLKWKYDNLDLGGSCRVSSRSSPSIASDGTIYVGHDGGSFFALNPDGTLKWEHSMFGAIITVPAIDEQVVYVGSESGVLYAIQDNGDSSEELWSFQTGGTIYSSPSIDSEGNVYVGSDDGKLYKINNGEKIWEFETEGTIFSSPAIDANINIYFGSSDGYYYKVNKDGEEVWKVNPEELGNSGSYTGIDEATGSPAIGEDGTVYFIGDGQLIAAEGEVGLDSSPWPKFKQNNQNTGKG